MGRPPFLTVSLLGIGLLVALGARDLVCDFGTGRMTVDPRREGWERAEPDRDVADLPPGWTAWRSAPGEPWQRGLWQAGDGPVD